MIARSLLCGSSTQFPVAASTAAGETVIREWLAQRGLDFPELVIGNGSGLSREARISGDSMARIMADAWKSRFAPEFLEVTRARMASFISSAVSTARWRSVFRMSATRVGSA